MLRVNKNSELEEAKTWLTSGDFGLEHHLYADQNLLTVEIKNPISLENFDNLTKTVDGWVENHGPLGGVVIRTRSFSGWENFGSFLSHLEFVKNHHQKIRRVGLVADGLTAQLLLELNQHFVEAQVKYFAYDKFKEAKIWATTKE